MSDTKPAIVPLPDDYRELQDLGRAYGLEVQGVKKVDLQAALCKIAEAQARGGDNPATVEDESQPDGASGADDDGSDADPGHCEDCPDPAACDAADACVGDPLDDEDSAAGDRAAITRTRPDGTWWCPFCDHSNGTDRGEACEKCRGCGAVRDGDEALAC